MAVTRVEVLSKLPHALRTWPSRKDSITILVTGRTHAGKSALINQIIGNKVAAEADTLSRKTNEVQGYSFKYAGLDLRVTLWDSPGLQDGSFRDEKYVSDMRSKGCADADLIFYCLNMNDTRFRQEDIDAITNLTAGLGKGIWNTAIFVMTFVNRVVERSVQLCDFQHLLRSWKRRLIQALESTGIDVEISVNIPVVPVGYSAKQVLPDREDWLESLWHESISRVQMSMLSGSTHEESKRLLELALQAGFVGVTIVVCVVLGPPGTGKTCLKYLLLDQQPPLLRSSTICAETPLRIEIKRISEARIQAFKGNWREVTDEGMLDVIARMILSAASDEISCFGANVAPKEASGSVFTKIVNWITKAAVKTAFAFEGHTTSAGTVAETEGASLRSVVCQKAIKNIMDKLVQRITELKKEGGKLEAFPHPLTEQLLRSLWVYFSDCGGQPQYHELLPLFVPHISSALCVTRLTDKLDEIQAVEYYHKGQRVGVPQQSQLSAKDTIRVLVNTIQSYSTQDKPPSIIMVGTHLDQLEKKMEQISLSEASLQLSSDAASAESLAKERIETLEEKNRLLLEMLEPEFSDQLVYFSRDMKQLLFPVNTLGRGEREKAIAHTMRYAVERSGAREVKVPVWWYVLELLLQELAKELGRGVLSRTECLEMARLLNVREESFNAALVYFNELNVIKYYPKVLPSVVFVDSQIPLDKVSELVYHSYLLRQPVAVAEVGEPSPDTPVTRGWKHFRDHGVVSDNILEHFPRHYVHGIFSKDELSKLLMSLLVFAEIPPPPWVKGTNSPKQRYYVSLALLLTLPEAELEKYRISSPVAATLLVRFPGGSRRAGVFCCVVTHLIWHCGWDLLLKSKQPLYRNCISLQLLTSPPCTITLIDSNMYIEVHVNITAPVPRSEYAGHFPIIRQAILNGIRSACSKLNYKTTKPELAILCPHTSPSPSPPSREIKHTATLTKDKKYWCCDLDYHISGLLDEQHSIWFGRSQAPTLQGAASRQDLPSGDFPALDSVLTLAKLSVLRTAGGKKIKIIERVAPFWESLGDLLDFDVSGSNLSFIKADHSTSEDCCRAMFQHWLNGNGVTPCSWRMLVELLEDLDEEVLAQEIQTALLALAM